MAVHTFRHAAKLSPSGHFLLVRLLAMLALLYSAALEERVHAWSVSGRNSSLYFPFGSLTAIRRQGPEWRGISVLAALSALVRLKWAIQAFFSQVRSGRKREFRRLRAGSRYCTFSVDHPMSARTRDRGRRGDLRVKGLPRMRFAIRRSLPPLDRLCRFRVVRGALQVEVQPLFEQVLPAVGRTRRNAPWGWMRASGTLPPFRTADLRSASGSLRSEAQSGGSSAPQFPAGEARRAATGRTRRLPEPKSGSTVAAVGTVPGAPAASAAR